MPSIKLSLRPLRISPVESGRYQEGLTSRKRDLGTVIMPSKKLSLRPLRISPVESGRYQEGPTSRKRDLGRRRPYGTRNVKLISRVENIIILFLVCRFTPARAAIRFYHANRNDGDDTNSTLMTINAGEVLTAAEFMNKNIFLINGIKEVRYDLADEVVKPNAVDQGLKITAKEQIHMIRVEYVESRPFGSSDINKKSPYGFFFVIGLENEDALSDMFTKADWKPSSVYDLATHYLRSGSSKPIIKAWKPPQSILDNSAVSRLKTRFGEFAQLFNTISPQAKEELYRTATLVRAEIQEALESAAECPIYNTVVELFRSYEFSKCFYKKENIKQLLLALFEEF